MRILRKCCNANLLWKKLSIRIYPLRLLVCYLKFYQELGYYRNEKQYADYFEKLLKENNIKYVREYRFLDKQFGQKEGRCVCDFVVEDKIIIELKTKDFISKEDYYQVKRYLVTLNLKLYNCKF